MFELVQALNDGAQALKKQTSNSISLNAGCELFIAFVTLFPHDSSVRPYTLAVFLPKICPLTPFIFKYCLELYRSEERAHSSRPELCQRSTHLSYKNRGARVRFH